MKTLEDVIRRTVEEVRVRAEEERTAFRDAARASVMEWVAIKFEAALTRHTAGAAHRPKRGPQARSGIPHADSGIVKVTALKTPN